MKRPVTALALSVHGSISEIPAAERAGLGYYPKLLLAVPFTPATGRRLLVAAGEPRETAAAALVAGARALAEAEGLRSIHVLFAQADEAASVERAVNDPPLPGEGP